MNTDTEAISCEWTYQGEVNATLSCPDLNEIEVIEAVYGRQYFIPLKMYRLNFRWDNQTCSDDGDDHLTDCNDFADHKEAVETACNTKSSCTWWGTNAVAGDPCFGTNKYTVVKYRCI